MDVQFIGISRITRHNLENTKVEFSAADPQESLSLVIQALEENEDGLSSHQIKWSPEAIISYHPDTGVSRTIYNGSDLRTIIDRRAEDREAGKIIT